MMQETLTFPGVGSPHHRFTFSPSSFTDHSEKCTPESTPFVSAPSSPGRLCEGAFYFSAPASPRWTRVLLANHGGNASEHPSSIHEHRDEDVATPCSRQSSSSSSNDGVVSFLMASDFEFSARFGDMDDPSMSPAPMSSANELFCNGQIRPLRIPSSCMRNPSSSATCGNTHGPAACSKNADGYMSSSMHTIMLEDGDMPLAFELNRRRASAGSSQMSASAPQSPRLRWNHGCHKRPPQSATSDVSHVNSSTSISAPQSPRFPLNKVKGVLCGLSPGAFSQGVTSVCSIGIRSHGHRRVRSFSPLTIFHRNRQPSPCSLSSSSSSHIRSPSAGLGERQSIDLETSQNEGESESVQKNPPKKWTLKDLLHRRSGGENRWSSSRSSSRHSGASADSVSSGEKTMKGVMACVQNNSKKMRHGSNRSSDKGRSENCIQCNDENSAEMQLNSHQNLTIKSTLNKISKPDSKSKPSKRTNQKGWISPHEIHYMMHKQHTHELRKKTFLPYRQELLGCLGFTSRAYRSVTTISKTLQSVSG